MNDREVGEYWERNAVAWTVMSRAGYDVCRDGFNTPEFVKLLGDVRGKAGLDIGCGEGNNTRVLARAGARMTGLDITPTFVRVAREEEARTGLGIRYFQASAQAIPLEAGVFDFATSFMCLMDLPDQLAAMREARRVLKVGGVFQYSITHPCFATPVRKSIRDERGKLVALQVGEYFKRTDGDVEEWSFGAAPEELKAKYSLFQVPRFHRTLGEWINTTVAAGFYVDAIGEPRPTGEAVARYPKIHDEMVMPLFLHVRCVARG